MLDIKFLRENPELVKENIRKKFEDQKIPMVDEVIRLDEQKRAANAEACELRANRNKVSKEIGVLMAQGKKEEAMKMKELVTQEAERLAELEAEGKLKAVITQNIDGLHQAAGSKNVLELHGSILRAYCSRCRRPFPADIINKGEGVPRCGCGGVIRPDIVLYEEPLDENVMDSAIRYIRSADVLIIGGTSLNVYPAAGLIRYYRGNKLVLVNLSETPYDSYADLVIHEKIGEVFSRV